MLSIVNIYTLTHQNGLLDLYHNQRAVECDMTVTSLYMTKLGSRLCELHISVPQHPEPQADCREKPSQGGEEGVVAMI